MDLEGMMLCKVSQTEKDKYCMASLRVEPKKYNKLGTITKRNKTNQWLCAGELVGVLQYRSGKWEVQTTG